MSAPRPPRPGRRSVGALQGLQWPLVATLAVVWVLLWGDLNAFNVVCGVLVAVVVVSVFPLPPVGREGTFRPGHALVLLGCFLVELVAASVSVAGTVLRFGRTPVNAVVAVEMRCRSDLHLAVTAAITSLVPGSLLLDTDPDRSVIYLHVLDVHGPDDLDRARRRVWQQERRVVRVLGSADALAAYEVATAEAEGREAQHG